MVHPHRALRSFKDPALLRGEVFRSSLVITSPCQLQSSLANFCLHMASRCKAMLLSVRQCTLKVSVTLCHPSCNDRQKLGSVKSGLAQALHADEYQCSWLDRVMQSTWSETQAWTVHSETALRLWSYRMGAATATTLDGLHIRHDGLMSLT